MAKNNKNPFKLGWFQGLTLYSSLGVLFLTGALLGFQESLNRDWFIRLLHIHGYVVPLFLVSFGALLSKHVTQSWNADRNRITGSIVTAGCAILILSGAILYYTGSELFREITRQTHLWVGWLLVLFLPVHITAGILLRKKKEVESRKKRHKTKHKTGAAK